MEPLYRDIIKRAWNLTWRNKFLWFFGLFAALLGNGGEYQILITNIDRVVKQSSTLLTWQSFAMTAQIQQVILNIKDFLSTGGISSGILLLVSLGIFLFIVWIVIISETALIYNAERLNRKEKSSFEESFRVSRRFFKPVLVLNLGAKLVVYGIFVIFSTPLAVLFLVNHKFIWSLLFLLISFLILVPLNIIVSFITKYAIAYVVLKKNRVLTAIKNGWALFVKNWLISLEMALVLFIINILVALLLLLIIAFLAIPFVLLTFIFLFVASQNGLILTLVVAIIFIFLVLFLFGAILAAFQLGSWTLLFLKLVEGRGMSKIARLASSFPRFLGRSLGK